jgi:cob(I)alamin adenosyltransferase
MEIWMVLIELVAQTDESAPSKIGFMNITTWADSQETAGARIQKYLESLGWHLVSIEQAHIVDEDKNYGEVEIDMIERTRNNPNAIILGTFHTYKTN